MKIKTNDLVLVTAGKDKGKKGKIVQVLPQLKKVVVEGANVLYKHLRPKKQGEKGQKIQFFAPLNVSNVQLVCPKCNRVTRLASKILEDKTKKRVCVKCKEIID